MRQFLTNILPVILAIFAIYLIYTLIDKDKETSRVTKDLQDLKIYKQSIEDSIQKISKLNEVYDNQVKAYKDSLDTLIKVKEKITIKYRDQKDFVINSADINQLDSVIRANAGIAR